MVETWLQDRMEVLGYQNYIFVTCGDWDLKTMLPRQCKAFKEEVPAVFQRWLNIKNFYAEATGDGGKKKNGTVGMLEGLSLKLEGRHHCGLDDCRNISQILIELLYQRRDVDKKARYRSPTETCTGYSNIAKDLKDLKDLDLQPGHGKERFACHQFVHSLPVCLQIRTEERCCHRI